MTTTIFVGSQFGDEGKAKTIDYFSDTATMVVRFAGGNNAGHTVVVNGDKIIFRLIPSGILRDGVKCVLGSGMVLDPAILEEEIQMLEGRGIDLNGRLFISDKAHVIQKFHKEQDSANNEKIGTTKKGIGPAYESKARRDGIRICDVVGWSEAFGMDIHKYVVTNASEIVNNEIEVGNVFFEGAQGTLLDIDHGTYPFVTSSNCIAGGACSATGVSPLKIDNIVGITKAYLTRVGNGPFPTEITDELGDKMREKGAEYGSVTGRPRRIGWLDLPALKYATMINGFSELSLTKLDVLTGLDYIHVCTSYYGKESFDPNSLEKANPVYGFLPGWKEDISNIIKFSDLPENAQKYINFIQYHIDVPINMISVGPDRKQTILRG